MRENFKLCIVLAYRKRYGASTCIEHKTLCRQKCRSSETNPSSNRAKCINARAHTHAHTSRVNVYQSKIAFVKARH